MNEYRQQWYNREVSSANSFSVDKRLWFRLFMYIRKRSGPKIDLWCTPDSISDYEDAWPLKKKQVDSCQLKNSQ